MPRSFPPVADPTAIGTVSAPPFAILPEPETLFATRRDRFAFLAEQSELGPYLRFLSGLSDAQDRVLAGLPDPEAPAPDRLDLARRHAMPPLDRAGFRRGALLDETLARFFDAAATLTMPDAARAALDRLRAAEEEVLDVAVGNVLADAIPVDGVAEHLFVAAGLQIHFARLASRLVAGDLRPIGQTLCPACGGPPVSSMVVGWLGSESTRFCGCPLCATLWHFVRIRCTACGSTKGVGYRNVEGGPASVKAETCDECGSYAKVLYQQRDPAMEPVADDVASLGLDLLMRDGPFRRSSYNPFLAGY